MPEDITAPVDEHPAGRAIDAFRIGRGVVTGTDDGADIQLVVVEFTYKGKMVDAIGLTPDLAAELGTALRSTPEG